MHFENDYFRSSSFDTLVMVSYQTLFIILTFGLILMFNKRLLVEVRTQEEKFCKAFHSSPYAITLTRLSDGEISEVNDGFVNISGYNVRELSGKTTIDLHLWDKEEDRVAAVKELTNSGRIHEREFQFRSKSGERITGLFSAEILSIDNQRYVLSSINDITERKVVELDREKLIGELQEALAKVKQLSGLLPICASCKKVREDNGYWTQIEAYVRDHSEAEFSHCICPACEKRLYPEFAENTAGSAVQSTRGLNEEQG
jgi:PAS domain S-box-containing protein